MKRIIFMLLVMGIAAAGFAEGEAEEAVTEISILTSSDGTDERFSYATDKFHQDYPDVAVRCLPLDLTTGSAMTMDALHEADLRPNIYFDHVSRTSKYMIPGYALPLDDVVRNLDQFNDGVLDPYRHDGLLYGIPGPSASNGIAINLDIMEEIGYTVPEDWTVDDFLEMCELVKQFYGGEKWGTFMYAKTMSGDYQINTWWGAFGAEMFESGDYSRTTIRETGGAKVHEFYQLLMSEGYIPPGSASAIDGETFAKWGMGMFAAFPFYPAWVPNYQKIGADRGYDNFDVVFVEFPTATGDPVPAYAASGVTIVIETGTEADAMAARFAEYLNDATSHEIQTRLSGIPSNRKDATVESSDPLQAQVGAIAAENGIQDIGLTSPFAAAVRAQHYTILQRVLNFELTPEESILLYEQKVNEALAY